MSTVETPEATAAAAPSAPKAAAPKAPRKAAKKRAAKKVAKKSAKKKAAKKGTKKAAKKAAKPSKNGAPRARKDGLRDPQVRVLSFLAKGDRSRTRAEIGKGAKVDVATLTEYIGSSDAETRKRNDQKMGWKSLISLGFVKEAPPEDEGITASAYV